VFERNDLRWIAFFGMGLTRTMTSFATGDLVFPTADFGEFGVRSVREGFELIFVTRLTGVTANVVIWARGGNLRGMQTRRALISFTNFIQILLLTPGKSPDLAYRGEAKYTALSSLAA
jgi:hypothetical protein